MGFENGELGQFLNKHMRAYKIMSMMLNALHELIM